MKLVLVGGAVRDLILKVPVKDWDFVFISQSFEEMISYAESIQCRVVQTRLEYGIIRCVNDNPQSHLYKKGLDFALPREDFDQNGRQCKTRIVKNLQKDLSRRDFTINSMALPVDKNLNVVGMEEIIDPFRGMDDCRDKILRFVGNPMERITEDELRILRGVRFSICKGLKIEETSKIAMRNLRVSSLVSSERIMEELNKCFQFDAIKTIELLSELDLLYVLKRVQIKTYT